ncbi:MAG: hypothetical protein WCY05_08145 [Candidatus Omnitrophota bacterium]
MELEITKVTEEQAQKIMLERVPLGLFYCPIKIDGERAYIGIDNACGESWSEAFKTLRACKRWLNRL